MRLLLLALVITFLSNTGFSGTDYSKDLDYDAKTGLIVIDDKARDHIVGDGLMSIMFEAAAEVVLNGYREVTGIRFSEIEPGSIYDLVGLRNGDVVTMIDGQFVTGIAHVMDLVEDLKRRDTFTYMVLRKPPNPFENPKTLGFKVVVR